MVQIFLLSCIYIHISTSNFKNAPNMHRSVTKGNTLSMGCMLLLYTKENMGHFIIININIKHKHKTLK